MEGVGSVDAKIQYSKIEEKGRQGKKGQEKRKEKKKTEKWTILFGSDRGWRRTKGIMASIIGPPGIAHHGPPFSAILDVV